MNQIILEREIKINAPLAHVWELVATEAGLQQWWGNPITLEAQVGGRCTAEQHGQHGLSQWQGVVTEYDPPHQLRLTLQAQAAQKDGPELTTISIALQAIGEQTQVRVVQRAFGRALRAMAGEQTPMKQTQPATHLSVPMAHLHGQAQPDRSQQFGWVEPNNPEPNELAITWQGRLATLQRTAMQQQIVA